MYKTPVIVTTGISIVFYFSTWIYEWYLLYRYRVIELYFEYEERLALLTSNHDGIMQMIHTRREIRDTFLKVIRAPFVLVGAVSGVVEKGASTIENVFVIVHTGVRCMNEVVPYALGILLLVVAIDISRRLRKISPFTI
tara:strand:+ start:1133 stop:1549 length:417 start_codon:yes stop_codon:yes gene_type:complete